MNSIQVSNEMLNRGGMAPQGEFGSELIAGRQ